MVAALVAVPAACQPAAGPVALERSPAGLDQLALTIQSGGKVHRFTADGRLDRSIDVPVSKPSMCAFGGPELDQLFIASIRPGKPSSSHRSV